MTPARPGASSSPSRSPVRVGLELADVVQQRAGDGHVAVDAGEGGADRADRLGHAEAVLEQAVAVGLVVVLGRRRDAIAGPQLGVLAEHPLEQDSQVRLLDRREQLAHLLLHLLGPARGAVEQVLGRVAAGDGLGEAAQVDLRAEARVHRVAPAHVHRRAGAGELLDPGQLLPDHRDDRARAVAELQAQVLAAVAPLAALGLADQQHLVDLCSVAELVHEHEPKV